MQQLMRLRVAAGLHHHDDHPNVDADTVVPLLQSNFESI